jgi:hypothetical protein
MDDSSHIQVIDDQHSVRNVSLKNIEKAMQQVLVAGDYVEECGLIGTAEDLRRIATKLKRIIYLAERRENDRKLQELND